MSVQIAKGDTISIAGVEFHSERFVVLTKKRKSFLLQDGTVGRIILDSYIVEIDLDESVLKLYDPTLLLMEMTGREFLSIWRMTSPSFKQRKNIGIAYKF